MASNFLYSTRDHKFILKEWLDLSKVFDSGRFKGGYSVDDVDSILENAYKIAKEAIAPTNEDGDTIGAKYKDDQGQPKVPDALAALAYDATNLMLQAIKDAGADDTTKVKDALAKITFNGVSGKITFDQQHNPVKSATILEVTPDKIVYNSTVNP